VAPFPLVGIVGSMAKLVLENGQPSGPEIVRQILEMLDIQCENPGAQHEFEEDTGKTILARFGNPVYPKPTDSLALSLLKPKTAALAFDRVYSIPTFTDPVPNDIGFYYATLPEVFWWGGGLLAITANKLGMGKPFFQERPAPEASQTEIELLQLICSEFPERKPTIFYNSVVDCDRDFSPGSRSILKAAISNVALVDESSLTWQQVIEFRQDTTTRNKYRRFIRWIDTELKESSRQEIEDLIAIRLDDYEWALKKHGMRASFGAISCLLEPKFLAAASAAVTASALAGGGFAAAALAGASLTVGKALVSFGSALIDGLDERRKENYEIAYIYEVRKQLGQSEA